MPGVSLVCRPGKTESSSNLQPSNQEGRDAIGIKTMSPELGFVLFVALLYGPTAVWLGYRMLRSHQGRLPESSSAVSEPMRSPQIASDAHEAPVGSDGFWVCESCRSLNRREANRCYGCRTAKGSAGRQVPDQLPVSRGVPVMADDIARSPGGAAGATVALAAPWNIPRAVEIPGPDPVPEPASSASLPEAPAGTPVCPFLGFRDDPSTRFDFPDPANRCHATSERGARSVAIPRRFVPAMTGTRRAQPIVVEHQESHCLTAAHRQCVRYPVLVA